ncbi:galactokinase [bacterium]|nr:galactokinase [bacterium]
MSNQQRYHAIFSITTRADMPGATTFDDAMMAFGAAFGAGPEAIVAAPGRVNLIGEHTDYNGGLALPMAVDARVYVLASRRVDDRVEAISREFGERGEFAIRDPSPVGAWHDAVRGAIAGAIEAGRHVTGANVFIASDVPAGSGLSSSAATCVGLVMALDALFGKARSASDVAFAARLIEHTHLGVPCGILDPLAIAAAREGCAMRLDCRDLSRRFVAIPKNAVFVVGDTGAPRRLSAGAYHERVRECADACVLLDEAGERVASLRDATVEMLMHHRDAMPDHIFRRARHVVTENTRVDEAARALETGDLLRFGALMNQSHASLANDYEVSSPALDAMVDAMRKTLGALGARLTGAGFGGSAVALCAGEPAAEALDACAYAYRESAGGMSAGEGAGRLFVARASAGALLLTHEGRPMP